MYCRQDHLSHRDKTMITDYWLTHSSCHVVGRTVTGMPDQLSFLIASAKQEGVRLFVCLFVYIYTANHNYATCISYFQAHFFSNDSKTYSEHVWGLRSKLTFICKMEGKMPVSRRVCICESLPSTTFYRIVCANKVPWEDVERQKLYRSTFTMNYCNNTCYRTMTMAVNW